MKHVTLSYWDSKHLETEVDVIIIGAGIAGLSCALSLCKKNPDISVRIIDKYSITRVASTRNAGFACFGSLTEILDDLHRFGESECLQLIEKRYRGIEVINATFSDSAIGYRQTGGFELIDKKDFPKRKAEAEIARINALLEPTIGPSVFKLADRRFGFHTDHFLIENPHEGQLNPAAFVAQLKRVVGKGDCEFFTSVNVTNVLQSGNSIQIETSRGNMRAKRVVLATNGLTQALRVPELKIRPARNVVLVSEPIDLPFTGVFHAEKGYIYFRNIDGRLLIGGGRHWDFENEFVSDLNINKKITERLKKYVTEVILPNHPTPHFEFEWAGIMGFADTKMPVIARTSERTFVAAGFGGMGVALGMQAGMEVADLVINDISAHA